MKLDADTHFVIAPDSIVEGAVVVGLGDHVRRQWRIDVEHVVDLAVHLEIRYPNSANGRCNSPLNAAMNSAPTAPSMAR